MGGGLRGNFLGKMDVRVRFSFGICLKRGSWDMAHHLKMMSGGCVCILSFRFQRFVGFEHRLVHSTAQRGSLLKCQNQWAIDATNYILSHAVFNMFCVFTLKSEAADFVMP